MPTWRARHTVISTAQQMASAHRTDERLGFVRVTDRGWMYGPDFLLLAYRLDLRRC